MVVIGECMTNKVTRVSPTSVLIQGSRRRLSRKRGFGSVHGIYMRTNAKKTDRELCDDMLINISDHIRELRTHLKSIGRYRAGIDKLLDLGKGNLNQIFGSPINPLNRHPDEVYQLIDQLQWWAMSVKHLFLGMAIVYDKNNDIRNEDCIKDAEVFAQHLNPLLEGILELRMKLIDMGILTK